VKRKCTGIGVKRPVKTVLERIETEAEARIIKEMEAEESADFGILEGFEGYAEEPEKGLRTVQIY
jgi:hypothetical protein